MKDGPLIGEKGKYRIEGRRPFAYGRISVLYRAKDAQNRAVCLKLFRELPQSDKGDKGIEDFFAELSAQQSLKHPNILPVLDFGEGTKGDPGPFIVYPICEGGNMASFLDERSFIPANDALPILAQVAAAIDFAHSKGFIHGDIKPENILLDATRTQAYLSDFGMARRFPIRDATTAVGEDIGGTSAYLSPEELEFGKQTAKSDIYSFGVVTFEVLTGALPFDVKQPLYRQMEAKIKGNLREAAAINPAVSKKANGALLKALSVDPENRPATANNVCSLLIGSESLESPRKISDSWWKSLDAKSKVAIITALIATIGGIITAIIKVLPELIK